MRDGIQASAVGHSVEALSGHVALLAGATRGAGCGIAVELALAGVLAHFTSRSPRELQSTMRRPCATWRDAIAQAPSFAMSETPRYIVRAVASLGADPQIMKRSGWVLATWNMAREYGFVDSDGTQSDWGTHARTKRGLEMG